MTDPYELALKQIITVLTQHGEFSTEERIVPLIQPAVDMAKAVTGEDINPGRLLRLVKTKVTILSPDATSMEDSTNHEPWLAEARAEINWAFWDRYRVWLESVRGLPPQVIRGIDDITDDIVGRLEKPGRPGPWDRRGLVAGQVQSGKTANYSALICKAADAGYKLIVILAGTHNNLRAQTQHRINEAFLGLDSARNKSIGVGNLPLLDQPFALSLTDSTDRGDFKLAVANAAGMKLGSDPLIVVMKKNATILRTFHEWVTGLNRSPNADGRSVVENIPMLVIDDEADSASVNTKKEELDPTRINSLIRQILESFEKSAYVGYTATPFANLFIDDAAAHAEFGEDLFPRSFIVALRPPSDYMGPGEVFGMSEIPELGQRASDGLPITRPVRDHEDWIPDRHKKDLQPASLPESLKTAINTFILTVAARRSRGQYDHNSMLIHVTRFNDVQSRVTTQVTDHLSELRNEIRYGGRSSTVIKALGELWRSDFEPTTAEVIRRLPNLDPEFADIGWDRIERELTIAVEHIQVRMINGLASDVLDYNDHENGLSVIAIGGDKLSRGLTLEGLSVSYYLRASRMYDTLMQMGRWFGYRPGYGDLCRMFTTDELMGWYRDIAAASEELWEEFEYMASIHKTPEDFGLRVRSHPGGLLVTAATKMRHGESRKLSYSGRVTETVSFSTVEDDRVANLDTAAALIDSLGTETEIKHHHAWRNVDPELIIRFLRSMRQPPDARRMRPDLMAQYISSASTRGELTDWTVVLIHNSTPDAPRFELSGHATGITFRQEVEDDEPGKFRIKRLLDPTHEALDLDAAETAQALELTVRNRIQHRGSDSIPNSPSGLSARSIRPRERGLLLLYLLQPGADGPPLLGVGVSFPISHNSEPIEYIVNNRYQQLELEFDDAY